MCWISVGEWKSGLQLEHRDPVAHRPARGDPARCAGRRRPPSTASSRRCTCAGRELAQRAYELVRRSACRRTRGPRARRSCAPRRARPGAPRRSSERLRPVGFWHALCRPDELHLVAREQALERVDVEPVARRRARRSRARPCARSAVIIPMKVGDSTTATSPGSSDGPRRQRDRLLGARGDHDLVGVLGLAVARARARRAARAARTVPPRAGRTAPPRRPPRTRRPRSRASCCGRVVARRAASRRRARSGRSRPA